MDAPVRADGAEGGGTAHEGAICSVPDFGVVDSIIIGFEFV